MNDPTGISEAEVDLDGPPSNVIATVWAKALGLDAVDPYTGFFDLGASSVTVVEVVRVLRTRWPRLRIVDIFAHPTVAQLTAFIDHA